MTSPVAASPLPKYLAGYPPELLAQAQALLDHGRLAAVLAQRYPETHAVKTDKALYGYVNERKQRHMRNAPPLSLVAFDAKLRLLQHALGTHTAVSRVQGGKLKAKREIRVASLFKAAPAALLEMIVVHELAHLKEPQHDKAFYALCCHMLPDYHQREFDLRLYLALLELAGSGAAAKA
ncbi:MAG: M48 family metallopeptidase [Vitreoscilla sp.]|nr:M48 family metallopeptidase [Vitreoscilla sp.]MBP6675581.1 M48 family metallopeptidase [Vitreoscilla sp.]